MTKNDRADRRLPTWVTVPEKIAGNISALIVSKVANGLTVPKDQGKVLTGEDWSLQLELVSQ